MTITTVCYSRWHHIGSCLGILKDLSPKSLTTDLWLSSISSRSYRAWDVTEHRSEFVVVPCAEEVSLTEVLIECCLVKTAVCESLDSHVCTCNTGITILIEVLVEIGTEVHKKVVSLHSLVVGSTTAEAIIRSCNRPQEVVLVHIVSDRYIEVIIDTGKNLLGISLVCREVLGSL